LDLILQRFESQSLIWEAHERTTPPSDLEDLKMRMRPSRRSRLLLLLAFLCVGIYACDYLSVRYRIAKNREPFGVVKIQRYYAVRQKDGKTEFLFLEPETQQCVHSLFPHLGCNPCWYVKRRKVKRIDM
jgi:hypothetical protein